MPRTHTTNRLAGERDAGSRMDLGEVRERRELNFRPEDGSWQQQTRTPAQSPPRDGGVPGESSKGSARGIANKEYVEHEFFTLEGDMSLIPDTETVRIKAGDTVNCFGLGKHLSGKYFVDEVTRTINSSDGYSHTILVRKNGFGDGLKNGPKVSADGENRPVPVRMPSV